VPRRSAAVNARAGGAEGRLANFLPAGAIRWKTIEITSGVAELQLLECYTKARISLHGLAR